MNNKLEVIGIDHGWSMMKTISQVFVTGVKEITTTPALFGDVLEYEGKFYKVGTVRQEVKDTKVEDDNFYLLTLAAVAKELKRRGLAEAKVFLAVGLPLTRFGAEKNDFIKYLTKNKRVSFKYENESYHIEIDDVAVFPQCYAAVVDKIPAMAKKTLIVDIGSWTIDIMPVINKSPDESKCVTIPKGLITCMRSINEQCVRQLNGEVDESEIQNIMRYGRSDIDDEYFAIIKAEIEDFVDKVYNSIREFGYNLKTTPIVFVGGGAVVMKNFGSHDAKNISYTSSTIARLRDDIEKKDKEMKRMGDRIESLEDKIISVATENRKEAESKAEPQESQSVQQADKKMVDTVAVPQNMQAVANGIPVYYQIPVVDGSGNVVQRLPIERSVRKSSNSGVASFFARLSFKKKSRADIVKLVASGDLVPAQLVQIKSAIEKGLTESQLVELINNNISGDWNNFIINSDDTIRKDPFFYSVTKGNIDYSYIEGIVE